jgi:hypothetical protein
VEAGHVKQQAQFSVLPDESLELGHKVLVIRFRQLPADVNDENLPAVFFIPSGFDTPKLASALWGGENGGWKVTTSTSRIMCPC